MTGQRAVKRLGLALALLALCKDVSAQHAAPTAVSAVQPSSDTHTVQPGDTLWGLSKRYLNNPFLWPKVWSFNPEVTNPNWIYPGDVIRFYPSQTELPSLADLAAKPVKLPQESAKPSEPEGPETPLPAMEGMPASTETAMPEKTGAQPIVEVVAPRAPPAGAGSQEWWAILGSFVTPKELEEAGTLVNAPEDQWMLGSGDVVYLSFPKDKQPGPGQIYMAYRTVAKVSHPIKHTTWGYMTQVSAVLTIHGSFGDLTEAKIKMALTEVQRGDYVTPLKQDLQIPVQVVKAKDKTDGYVLALQYDSINAAGEYQVAFIDKGKDAGIVRGNRFRVSTHGDPFTGDMNLKPEIDIGTLLVVEAKDNASTCLVTKSYREISPGDRIQAITK